VNPIPTFPQRGRSNNSPSMWGGFRWGFIIELRIQIFIYFCETCSMTVPAYMQESQKNAPEGDS